MIGILAFVSILIGVDPVYSVSRGDFDASVPMFSVSRGEFQPALADRSDAKPAVEKDEIEILIPRWKCSHCDTAKSDVGKWKSNPYKITFREVDDEASPDGFPRATWKVRGVKWGFVGWYGIDHLDSEFRKSRAEKTTVKSKSVLKTSQTRRLRSDEIRRMLQSYRGPDAYVKGMTYWNHLQDGNHGFAAWQLNGLNQWELMRLHGAHHNGYIHPVMTIEN